MVLSEPENFPLVLGSHHQPYARCRARFHAGPPCRLVLPAEASHQFWLMRDDPARLTSYSRGYFTVRYVAVQITQARGIRLNPTWDWEQC
jgi:hypothetical protein